MNQSTIGCYYFKVVRTTNTKIYTIPINITVQEFLRVIKLHILDDFGYNTIDEFELVLAGQQVPGIQHAEDVPAIDFQNLTGSLYDNYSYSESFYIRPVIQSIGTSINSSINSSILDTSPETGTLSEPILNMEMIE